MMNIAVYGRKFGAAFSGLAIQLFEEIKANNANIYVKDSFKDFLNRKIHYTPNITGEFNDKLPENIKFDLMISIGGDGTFLEAASVVNDTQTPMLGINTGKMGFMAYVNADNMLDAIKQFFNKEYKLDKRMLLKISSSNPFYGNYNYCLNDFAIQKCSRSRMIKIQVFSNENYINTYWSDGLIISTPTGSSAYSLSCGGPIIEPGTNAIVITAIAPHNLSVRPLVLSGESKIRIVVDTNEKDPLLASLDFRDYKLKSKGGKHQEILIEKADFTINFVSLKKNNYFCTLRSKLMWGSDIRN